MMLWYLYSDVALHSLCVGQRGQGRRGGTGCGGGRARWGIESGARGGERDAVGEQDMVEERYLGPASVRRQRAERPGATYSVLEPS